MVIVLYHAFRVVTEIRFSNHLLEAIALVALVLVGVFVTLTVIIALSVAVSECLRVRVCR
ncbi:MAG: hypothetical protein DRJ96_05770 [Thermoprotei archaeon]|nr:MAG: hypothetical protein DRJ96_05770 [Thermoprotei archaeon]